MRRFRLTVAYDGTAYAGWQVQPGDPTVQQTIEKALEVITGATVKIHGSGRTDQGVHARGQWRTRTSACAWMPPRSSAR